MTKKTQAAYTAVLQYIKEQVLATNNIILAMTDFERALRNVITECDLFRIHVHKPTLLMYHQSVSLKNYLACSLATIIHCPQRMVYFAVEQLPKVVDCSLIATICRVAIKLYFEPTYI